MAGKSPVQSLLQVIQKIERHNRTGREGAGHCELRKANESN